ncbi:atrial natriuretic peptide receptor 1-like [Paramacrobiotus metropolitanus]|uniref:atrial natriuretic peptide receptor 1-like n=1 Tax=Paramacrobiotus metropolitanus TaxID=2943436 RepID=UPI0024461F04|nr:atrial natriuretic peptide receptor 1-like [Paramacrobiotus metropolitanus]
MGVRGLVEGGDNMEIIYQYDKKSGHLVAINGTRWPLNGSAPLNRPACGFRGENPKCHQRGLTPESSITTIAASTTAVALIAAVIFIGMCFIRRHQQSRSVNWLIPANQVQRYFPSFGTYETTGSSHSLHSRHTKTGTLAYRNVYVYGSQLVWCRSGQLNHGTTHLSGKLIKRINMRSALKHNNIVDLVGVALEKDKIMIFSQYCPKGSLYEIIEEKPSWLSWDLKTAMLADIINGLAFIHSSDLKFHGALKSPNCMVTNQLVVKLTDFGWPKEMTIIGQTVLNKQNYSRLLWTAPEILRNSGAYPTREADIYALGIIMHEVVFTVRPFGIFTDGMDTEVIQMVHNQSASPYRPFVKTSDPVIPIDLIFAMQHCWAEDPLERPKIAKVKLRLMRVLRFKDNYMDRVMRKLKHYAEDLERQAMERTQELRVEKCRNEQLLKTILPATIADALIRGFSVEAEIFDSATVAFVLICDFAEIILQSSPWEYVTFLNEVFTFFDDLIGEYDAYKVETISGTYMLVSGVPVRNGTLHAEYIGLLCSRAMLCSEKRIFASHQLKLQIGLHSGSLAAGLVGLRMKRYCLFGDTVNMASRMAETSSPQHIQASESSRNLLKDSSKLFCLLRGDVPVKGKGIVTTFWII